MICSARDVAGVSAYCKFVHPLIEPTQIGMGSQYKLRVVPVFKNRVDPVLVTQIACCTHRCELFGLE